MKRIKWAIALVLFFSPVFARSVLANQLFWDYDSLYDYAARLGSHPEVPSLPMSDSLQLDLISKTKYDELKSIVDVLRKTQSETKVIVIEVQKQSLNMQRWFYFSKQVFLRIMNKGITPLIDELIIKENTLNSLHVELTNLDFYDFLMSVENSETLSNFAGRVATNNKITYSDLEITAKTFKKLDYKPFLTLTPFERGCAWNFANSTFTVPKYRFDFLLGQSTPLCDPNKFYTEPQIETIIIGPDWSELLNRLDFLNDFNLYLRAVTKFTNEFSIEVVNLFDKNQVNLERAKNLNTVLNKSDVRLALIEISDSSSLSSSSVTFDFENIENEFNKLELDLINVRTSKNLGEKFEILEKVQMKLNYFESNFNEIWSLIESKIKTMEELCISYGSTCAYQGDALERLEKTSKTFLSLRLDHMVSLNLNDEVWKIKLTQAESIFEDVQNLIVKIEDYSKISKILAHQDTMRTFEIDIKFFSQQNKIFQTQLDTLLFDLISFKDEIVREFVLDNKENAIIIKTELFGIKELLRERGVLVNVDDKSLSLFSTDVISNLIYYITNEEYLNQLKSDYDEMLSEYLSNIPSKTQCIPIYPTLNEDFDVECVTIINNTWGIHFKKASSIIDLDYVPNRLTSANFVSDASHLDSVSFSGNGPVRLNLEEVGSLIIFEFNYKSNAGTATSDCLVFSEGLSSKVTCTILTTCEYDKARVPMDHPFSGKEMKSNVNYVYDGKRIYIEVPCNEYSFVEFNGPSVEIIPTEKGVVLTNLVNSTIEFVSEFPQNETGLEFDSVFGATLSPFEKKEIFMDSDLTVAFSEDAVKKEVPNLSELLGYSSLEMFSDDNFNNLRTSYGCVETNIKDEVSKTTKIPKLTCIELPSLKRVKELFDAGMKKEAALEYFELIEPTELKLFLMKSLSYKDEAKNTLDDAKEATSNIVSSTLAGKYLKEAESAYLHKDYITSLYYSKYTLIKSAIPLEFGLRTILAAGILVYGVYSTKNKETEELI